MSTYTITFKQDAPSGYGGTHQFFTVHERNNFLQRAKERGVGPEWIARDWSIQRQMHNGTFGKYAEGYSDLTSAKQAIVRARSARSSSVWRAVNDKTGEAWEGVFAPGKNGRWQRAFPDERGHKAAENPLHLSEEERARVLVIRAQEHRRRRISEIEDSLARPVAEGREWDRHRAALERELDILRRAN